MVGGLERVQGKPEGGGERDLRKGGTRYLGGYPELDREEACEGSCRDVR